MLRLRLRAGKPHAKRLETALSVPEGSPSPFLQLIKNSSALFARPRLVYADHFAVKGSRTKRQINIAVLIGSSLGGFGDGVDKIASVTARPRSSTSSPNLTALPLPRFFLVTRTPAPRLQILQSFTRYRHSVVL